MSGGITPEFLSELKFKCDIADIISLYVPLTKKGGRYFGSCPFHNEKTGSFCVNQADGFYHCFGCGASGDVVKFIMEIESLSFYDAVRLLADKVGMVMPEFKSDPDYQKKKDKNEVLKQLMRDAARYYRNNLLDADKGKDAAEYLNSRGISEDISARYGLGLSLDYDSMPGYLRRKNYTVQNLIDAGLINQERLSDAFANRIIVPIFNPMNDVVAFGGRVYHGETEIAKYKNSTNTPLFDKSRTVYGINFIKKDKKEGISYSCVILVEGYMDVISLGAAGIKNVVAGMGTALTDGQVNEIKRVARDVVVCYDGDAAGRKASVRNVEPLVKAGLEIKIVSLPDGADPDDVVRGEGASGFMKYVSEALPLIDYKLKLCRDAYDVETVNGRAKYVTAAVKALSEIDNRSEREVYLKVVSDVSGVSVSTLKDDAETAFSVRSDGSERASKDVAPASTPGAEAKNTRAARFVLNKLLLNAPYVDADNIKSRWFAERAPIADFILSFDKGKVNVSEIFVAMPDNEEINRILDVNDTFAGLPRETDYYNDCLMIIADNYLEAEHKKYMERYNAVSGADEKRAVLIAAQECQKKQKSKNIKDKL